MAAERLPVTRQHRAVIGFDRSRELLQTLDARHIGQIDRAELSGPNRNPAAALGARGLGLGRCLLLRGHVPLYPNTRFTPEAVAGPPTAAGASVLVALRHCAMRHRRHGTRREILGT